MQPAEPNSNHTAFIAHITAAYVSNHPVPIKDIPALMMSIKSGLVAVETRTVSIPRLTSREKARKRKIQQSITEEYIISYEDGKRYQALGRHLNARGMTPDEYREKWGLPVDYPMTAPNYSAVRSKIAKRRKTGGRNKSSDSRRGRAQKSKSELSLAQSGEDD